MPNFDKTEERECRNGHLMRFYENTEEEEMTGEPSFFECPVCGDKEEEWYH